MLAAHQQHTAFYTQHFAGSCATTAPSHLSLAVLAPLLAALQQNQLPAFTNALPEDHLQLLRSWCAMALQRFDHVVFLGMGGSSLGGQMLNHFAAARQNTHLHLHFWDMVDSTAISTRLNRLPLARTGFVVVSKSGTTIETLLQLGLVLAALQHYHLPPSGHVAGLTELNNNPLHKALQHMGCTCLPHHAGIGGRFSVLSTVGMLPAMLAGISVGEIQNGAHHTQQQFLHNPTGCAPALGAAWAVQQAAAGKKVQVCMPYGEALRLLPHWYAQLWAESLGKNGQGSTPFAATGPADQHSVLQLFLDGPADKTFTLIYATQADTFKGEVLAASMAELLGTPALAGLSGNRLMYAQALGTAAALANRNLPVRHLTVTQISATSLGALLMHFMLETAIAAALWHLNAFNQPAVEESKQQTLALLAKEADKWEE